MSNIKRSLLNYLRDIIKNHIKENTMKFLIVVDMQNDFISGALGSKLAEAIVPNVVPPPKMWCWVWTVSSISSSQPKRWRRSPKNTALTSIR